ncbi:MAG: DUF2911 domain-containing protein [Bacteroidia bacterium]|nr:DUF2911 domain-containing protein [Bacteroidia bacterium]
MNKQNVFRTAVLIAFGMFSSMGFAQKILAPAPSPLQTVNQKFGLGEITVEYSRPAARGRVVFGEVVPFDKIWRTGANNTTKITFTDDVTLEGIAVKAGTYGIYTIPHKTSWEIMLTSDLELGGNVNDYKIDKEVARIKVITEKTGRKIESFTIEFDNVLPTSAMMTLAWENTSAPIKITTDIDARVMRSIEESMKSPKPEYFRAATYYFENGKDLKKALDWATKATNENPKAYYMMLLKAKIEYALGDKKAGNASAEKVISLAKEAKSDDYVRMATELMAANK